MSIALDMIARDKKERKKRETIALTLLFTMGIVAALFVVHVPTVFALPSASTVIVADVSGDQGTSVVVPVTVKEVQNGPIISIIFDIVYDNSVIDVVGVQNGELTALWDSPSMNNFAWGTRVSLVYDGQTAHGLQNGATGSIILLTVNVSGEQGETSWMNLTNIQFADTAYDVGTASARNGTFTISTESDTALLSDTGEDSMWSEAYWEESGLWHITERRSKSPGHSWWYGQEATGTYDTGSPNSGCLVSKAIDLTDTTAATLTFWTCWTTEPWSCCDQKLVEVSVNGGAWTVLEKLPEGSGVEPRAIDLPVGNTIKIRFRFDTVDDYYNTYEGWFIDNIRIELK